MITILDRETCNSSGLHRFWKDTTDNQVLREHRRATRRYSGLCRQLGGADLLLSGDYRLQIFPDGSLEEDWRFVELQGRHIVIEGGRVRIDE